VVGGGTPWWVERGPVVGGGDPWWVMRTCGGWREHTVGGETPWGEREAPWQVGRAHGEGAGGARWTESPAVVGKPPWWVVRRWLA
jgi:hypothetical protein